ncbi:MAG TPA: type II secretion system F family protein [Terriglobales bacterium]
MAEYLVKVANEHGRISEQTEHGASPAEIRDRFAQQGYFVFSVKPKGMLARRGSPLRGKRVKQEQFLIFNQQFVTLIRAGLPIPQSLELLAKRQRNTLLRSIMENVRERVRAGELLSEAFKNAAPGAISQVYLTTLLAGERSGNLEEVLNRYILFERLSLTFKKKLLSSLIYPALLVTMVSLMFTFLLSYVVPQFKDLYAQIGNGQLPSITVFVINVGVGIQHYILFAAAAVLVLGVFLWRWGKTGPGAEKIDAFRLSVPVFGQVWLKYQVAIFCRMLSTLLSGGLPLVQALETAGNSLESKQLSKAVLQSVQKVREGRSLSRSLEESRVFPALGFEMIEVGESTGALPAMLVSVAEFFEDDVQNALSAALSLIEPVILIVMGVVVAFVLIALYLPIFSLGAAATGG